MIKFDIIKMAHKMERIKEIGEQMRKLSKAIDHCQEHMTKLLEKYQELASELKLTEEENS